jgi:hypothetical protein
MLTPDYFCARVTNICTSPHYVVNDLELDVANILRGKPL